MTPTLDQLLLIAAKAAGAPEVAARTVAAQLGKQAKPTKELEALLRALDAGLRTRWRTLDAGQLAAARAVLFGLELMVREGEDTRQSIMRRAGLDADSEARALDRYGDGQWQCARCGSQRIDDEHTGRDRLRFIQLLCDACGATTDGTDGDASLEAWKRAG